MKFSKKLNFDLLCFWVTIIMVAIKTISFVRYYQKLAFCEELKYLITPTKSITKNKFCVRNVSGPELRALLPKAAYYHTNYPQHVYLYQTKPLGKSKLNSN
jgi:hypothetical protein